MTLPHERFRAVQYVRQFLYELIDPKKTAKIPKTIRQRAAALLRHYPLDYEMEIAAKSAPELFTKTINTPMPLQRSNKKYDGYMPSDKDIVINGCRLILTCTMCPEQYDVFQDDTGSLLGYLRLRHGQFRADCPDVGGETVYETTTQGDGCFEDDERMPELTNAVDSILSWWSKMKKEYLQ